MEIREADSTSVQTDCSSDNDSDSTLVLSTSMSSSSCISSSEEEDEVVTEEQQLKWKKKCIKGQLHKEGRCNCDV